MARYSYDGRTVSDGLTLLLDHEGIPIIPKCSQDPLASNAPPSVDVHSRDRLFSFLQDVVSRPRQRSVKISDNPVGELTGVDGPVPERTV